MRKVFISSVIKGFEDFRKAAKRAVEIMRDEPLMAEDFAARSYSSELACITEVESSDVYILILGEKYGFETPDGISVTQTEFHAARDILKTILVFIQDTAMEEKQQAFRREVENYKKGFFRKTFSTAEELKEEIIGGLRQLEQTYQAASEEEFLKKVEAAIKGIAGRSSEHDPELILAFWPQPQRPVDLESLEKKADENFALMGREKLTLMREGYRVHSKPNWTCIESSRNSLAFFDDGLVFLALGAKPARDSTSYSLNSFVPPSHIRALCEGAHTFFGANSGWCYVELRGMGYSHVGDPPVGRTSVGFPIRGQQDCRFQSHELLMPFQKDAFLLWVDTQVKRMKRQFSER